MTIRTLSDLVFRIRDLSSGRSELLSSRIEGRRVALSTADFLRGIHSLALALESRGVKQGDRIAIFSENRPEWHMIDFAGQLLGAQSVPVCPTQPASQVGFILRNSACRWVFYDTKDRGEMLASLESSLTSPPRLVALAVETAPADHLTTTRLMGEGAARQGEVPLERFRSLVDESATASLVYRRGATGDPERERRSHRDLIAELFRQSAVLNLSSSDQALAGLPLAQGLQRTIDHVCFHGGASIHYLASIDELSQALANEKPSLLAVGTDAYSQLFRRVQDLAEQEVSPRRWLFRWALNLNQRHAAVQQSGAVGPFLALQRKMATLFVFRRACQQLGGKLRYAIYSGEPPPSAECQFFSAAGIPLVRYESDVVSPDVSSVAEPQP